MFKHIVLVKFLFSGKADQKEDEGAGNRERKELEGVLGRSESDYRENGYPNEQNCDKN